jgi:hypothetical protein
MKNSFRMGLLALVIASSIVACEPPKVKSAEPKIDSPAKPIDTAKKAVIDSAKKDTTKKP